ncbi:MAG TPA: serine hydrolase domain-containing protein [Sphingomicrobium sp.]|nr:serine hydrolase domain-containing protein [Sphingomicrobium sp.]
MTMTNHFLTALAAAVVSLAVVPASALAQTSEVVMADVARQADVLLKSSYPADGPGSALIVARGGEVIYAGAQGLADIETRRPITADTPFLLGSITKQFTAAVVLQLVAEGKMSLDDPLSRFFPDWPAPTSGATVRQFLNHTSGLQDFSKVPGWIAANRDKDWTTEQLLDLFRKLPAKSEPGTQWEYNNGGYVMLGAIVEKMTGKPWHEVIAERIARPLGLTTLDYADADQMPKLPVGYSDEDGRPVAVRRPQMSIAHAAGGIAASVTDIAKWADALHNGRVVRPDLYREMTSPARLADGSTEPYGFGLRLQKVRGRQALVHGGSGAGLDTDSIYIPAEKLFVAVFANSDDPATDPSLLTRRLSALALGQPIPTFTPAKVEMPAVEPLFGAYAPDSGPPFLFSAEDGKLYMSRGGSRMEAFAAGGDRFFFGPDRLLWVSFVRKPDGAHVMELHEPDSVEPETAVRTGPVPPQLALPEAVLESYAGIYKTETVTVTVAVSEDGKLTVTPPDGEAMVLRPTSQTEFRIDGTPMRVVFHPENGVVNRFTMYRGARELHGVRQ